MIYQVSQIQDGQQNMQSPAPLAKVQVLLFLEHWLATIWLLVPVQGCSNAAYCSDT
jgi:hypothetical protein